MLAVPLELTDISLRILNEAEDYISSGILELFVLDELPTAERQEVMDMAARHPAVREEIALVEDTLQGVAESLAQPPPHHLLARIEAQIYQEPSTPDGDEEQAADPPEEQLAHKTKKIHYWQYGVAATFTLKVAFMAVAAYFWLNWQQTENRLNRVQKQYGELEQQAQQVTQTLMAINDPAVQTVVLRDSASDTRVLAYWNRATDQLYVDASSLPPNDRDERYQVWGTQEGEAISLGTFEVDARTSLPQVKTFEGQAGLSELLISIAPEGEDAVPTSDQIRVRGRVE